jgi:Tfp pilus assembly protein PilF
MENFKLLCQIYFRPRAAMSEIIDKGSWVFAAAAMLFVSFAFQYSVNSRIAETYAVSQLDRYLANSSFKDEAEADGHLTDEQLAEARYFANVDAEKAVKRPPFPVIGKYAIYLFSFDSIFFAPLISISVFYVPGVIILVSLFGGDGRTGLILRRDYGMLATCSLMAWAAAHLPFAIAGALLYSIEVAPEVYLAMWLASSILFGVFMIFAQRVVLGANYAVAAAVVCIGWLAFSFGMYVFRHVSPWLFSPFLLFYAYFYLGGYLGGEVRGFSNNFRQRQNFKRFLHNATVNPKDADAHVELALIYLQRRQDEKALEHLNKAIDIDAEEIDANYELGKLARAKGDLPEAIRCFSVVVEQNDKHALSEIWREIGATYLAANMLKEARDALEKFVERRPVDPEGLYYLGKTLKAQGEIERAVEMFRQVVESEQTSPDFRRRSVKHWSKMAQKEI